jgi:adenosylcobyric acid synthase
VDHRDELHGLDLLILPGTKNTISDLLYLKETGLFRQIQAYVREGGRLVGICGGYQILGQEVRDPLGVEGDPRAEAGLGLLPVVTTMAGAKTTTQVQARVPDPRDCGVLSAYEIHMGVTETQGEGQPAFEIVSRNGQPLKVADGWVSPDRRLWGTYLHGLFDNDLFRRVFLHELRRTRPGMDTTAAATSYENFQEAQLDRLADLLRRHLDLAQITAMIRT